MTISGAGPAVESVGAVLLLTPLHIDFLPKNHCPKCLDPVELRPGLGGLPCRVQSFGCCAIHCNLWHCSCNCARVCAFVCSGLCCLLV